MPEMRAARECVIAKVGEFEVEKAGGVASYPTYPICMVQKFAAVGAQEERADVSLSVQQMAIASQFNAD